MANLGKGKSLSISLLFILASLHVLANSNSVSIPREHNNHVTHCEPETESSTTESNPQYVLLHKLEELVRNLSEIVARLESRLLVSSKVDEHHSVDRLQEQARVGQIKHDDKRSVKGVGEDGFDGEIQDGGERAGAVSVAKYSPFSSERFQFVSAVKLNSEATSIHLLPFRDYEGLSKYVAVGDDRGRVHVFLRNGDVLVEFYTTCESPITAMVSYMTVYKNESFVVTGHQNGVISVHKVYERSNGEEWSSIFMENVGKFASDKNGEDGYAINILEVRHIGRLRYILSSDASGKIKVFKEDGMVHGYAILSSRPLAFLRQKLLFLTEKGAGSLDLRSMKIRESECEGLNHSLARNYVFDATERSKAYGLTSEGELIHVLLLGDGGTNFKCRVRSKRKYDIDEPLAFQAIKGYLLIVNDEKVFVYNVSSQHYIRGVGPRLLFSTGLDEIRSSFLNYQATDADSSKRVIPLIASDSEKLIVIGLGGGYVGIYRSNLPVFKGELNTMLWTSPVLFFILFLFGAWQFFAKKKEAFTSWGPDDPFSSSSATTTGVPLGSNIGDRDRSFVNSSSRNSDIMGSGLRGPSRRFVSSSQYAGGATNSFRPSSSDPGSRPAQVDPNYRAVPELKYRGPNLESAGFPKRREGLFVNNQAVDDSS